VTASSSCEFPTVSIVMPFLNAAPYLAEAIESVIRQSYDRWELLLVDDGSTDGSSEIARSFQRADPGRIIVLGGGASPRGASAARNLALEHAAGELIAFLDADDVWLPNKLAEQVALLAEHREVGVLYGRTLYWHSWRSDGTGAGRDHMPELGFPGGAILQPPELLTAALNGNAPLPCTCSLIARKSVVHNTGGFEERFRRVFTDQAFYTKLFLATSVMVADRCWDKYRQHDDSSCLVEERSKTLERERLRYLDWAASYLASQQLRGTEVWKIVQMARVHRRHPRAFRLIQRGRRLVSRPLGLLRRAAYGATPPAVRRALGLRRPAPAPPPVGRVRFGSPGRSSPISSNWGWDRGLPVDRRFIENYLEQHIESLQGRLLEVGDDRYSRRFGGDRVERLDILHVSEGNPQATLVGDLATADHLPSDEFDCIVLTQTLQYVYDLPAAMRTLHRILKPGGVLLATVPGISRTEQEKDAPRLEEPERWKEARYWSFTPTAVARLAAEAFSPAQFEVETYGNVWGATAFLHGLAAEELPREALEVQDPAFPVLITLTARKPSASQR
jgi:glycosyltransferase involved in cell wall biosynthesis